VTVQLAKTAHAVGTEQMRALVVSVVAPSRLEATGEFHQPRFQSTGSGWQDGDLPPSALAEVFGSMTEITARNLIEEYLCLVADLGGQSDFEAYSRLWLRVRTVRDGSPLLSESCLFDLNDIGIGLLFRMGRSPEAHELLWQQRRKVAQLQDRSFSGRYLAFYDKVMARCNEEAALGLTLSFGATRSFCCFQEWLHTQHADWAPQTRRPIRQPPKMSAVSSTPPVLEDSVDAYSMLKDWVDGSTLPDARKRWVHDVLQRIWEHDARLQTASRRVMDSIECPWKDSLDRMTNLEDYDFLSAACLLRWRTYHVLMSCWHPLSPEERERKNYQRAVLMACFQELSSKLDCNAELPDVLARFGETVRLAIEIETAQTLSRLDEALDSPANSLAFRPLPEDRFAIALERIRHRAGHQLQEFVATAVSKEKELMVGALRTAASNGGRIDFFQNDFQAWLSGEARIMVSLVAAEMFSEYCLRQRNIDFSDRSLFPFESPEGVQVVYRLQGGLTMDMTLPYEEARE
jgi:hypothetical protein